MRSAGSKAPFSEAARCPASKVIFVSFIQSESVAIARPCLGEEVPRSSQVDGSDVNAPGPRKAVATDGDVLCLGRVNYC